MNRWTSPSCWPTVVTENRAGRVTSPLTVNGRLAETVPGPSPSVTRTSPTSTVGSRTSGTAASAAGAAARSATQIRPWSLPATRSTPVIRLRSTPVTPDGSTISVCAQYFSVSSRSPSVGSVPSPTGVTSALAPSASVSRTRSCASPPSGSTIVRSSRRSVLRSSGSSSTNPPDWPAAVHVISKNSRVTRCSYCSGQCGCTPAHSMP